MEIKLDMERVYDRIVGIFFGGHSRIMILEISRSDGL